VAIATVAAVLPASAPATADDRAVLNAYNGRHDAMHSAFNEERRAYRALRERVTRSRTRRAIKADQRVNRIAGLIEGDVEAARASSDEGEHAKELALNEISHGRRGCRVAVRGFRAWLHGRYDRGDRLLRKSAQIFTTANKLAEKVHRAFKKAGLNPRHTGIADGA
jgi:hypothetical protein